MLNFIEFRNAFYHGQTQEGKPHGLGIIIDNQFMFLLAEFREGEIQGPVFVVYADCKIFCGRIKNKELSGLCCFYIKDKMQIYMNYSQSKSNNKNLIAILPFCKVILQVDNSQELHPKVKKYENYGGKGADLKQALQRLFGKCYELDQYSNWQNFLMINFIKPHYKKLYWRPTSLQKYNQYFLGNKNEGLGIKILVFHDKQFANKVQGSPFMVSAIGKFNREQMLRGYGQRLIDYQFFSKVQEGVFYQKEKQTFEYLRKNRSNQAKNFFNKNLLKSINFENYFYNLSFLYNLEKIYAKLNVSLVQETHKIALITINRPDHSPIELAEIQRRQRKRSQVPLRTKYSPFKNFQVPRDQRSSLHKQQSTYFQNNGKSLFVENRSIEKQNQSASMSEAKKSIKGSIQKIKKINQQTRIKAIKKYDQLFENKIREPQDSLQKKSFKQNLELKHQKAFKPKIQTTYNEIENYTRNLQQTYKYKPKQDKMRYYQRKNQLDEFITGRKKNIFTPTKYELIQQRQQKLRLKPSRNQNYFYSTNIIKDNQEFFTFTRNNTDLKMSHNNLPVYKQRTPDRTFNQSRKAYSKEREPQYKKIFEDEVYSNYQNGISQKQQQLKYFNDFFQVQTINDLPPMIKRQRKTYIQQPPIRRKQNDRNVSPNPFKNKTPGKIKIISKKKQEDYFY